jgi:hypothetical protein
MAGHLGPTAKRLGSSFPSGARGRAAAYHLFPIQISADEPRRIFPPDVVKCCIILVEVGVKGIDTEPTEEGNP